MRGVGRGLLRSCSLISWRRAFAFASTFLRGFRRASRGGRGRRRGLGRLPDVLQDVVVEHDVIVGVDGAGEGVFHGCDGAACAQRQPAIEAARSKAKARDNNCNPSM